MQFFTEKPNTERTILILCNDGNNKYLIQGHFYIEEGDYYNYEGELLSNAICWAEMPKIDHIYQGGKPCQEK